MAYQRCCRLSSLTNIISPDRTGITLYATIPDSVYIENSSPVFNNLPFTLLCENVPFTFDNSATDADVDSLVYSLCTPLNGGSMSVPAPDPPSNPPYDSISWLPPYSLSNLMGGSPFTINQQTGLLSGTPNSAGVFNYGVCVSEYRNGIYLGNTMRDFQVTVFSIIGIQENSIEKFITSYTGNNSNNIIFKISPDLYINDAEIIIYNMLGKEVGCTKNINENEIIFERKSMAVGIYSFRFFNKGMLVGTSKIILN